MDRPFSFETFLRIFEAFGEDRPYAIDETSFFFEDDPLKKERCLGCLPRDGGRLYWAGYCDLPEGVDFPTAADLLDAPVFDGKSVRERWDDVVFLGIGGLSVDDWMNIYGCRL